MNLESARLGMRRGCECRVQNWDLAQLLAALPSRASGSTLLAKSRWLRHSKPRQQKWKCGWLRCLLKMSSPSCRFAFESLRLHYIYAIQVAGRCAEPAFISFAPPLKLQRTRTDGQAQSKATNVSRRQRRSVDCTPQLPNS